MRTRMKAAIVAMAGFMVGACQTAPSTAPMAASPASHDASVAPTDPPHTSATSPTAATGKVSDLAPDDLRDVLAELDKNHHDRMKLGFWVSTPFRSVEPAFRTFYKNRAEAEKPLANELESWAKAHGVDLTYHYGTDTFGQAQKIMEGRQEKLVRADDKEDFGRDMLIDEFQDYEFGISLVTALLPSVHDPALRSYLEKSLHSQEAATAQVQAFLKQFKYSG